MPKTTILGQFAVSQTATFDGATAFSSTIDVTGTATVSGEIQAKSGVKFGEKEALTHLFYALEAGYDFGTIAGNAVATKTCTVTGVLSASRNAVLVDTPAGLDAVFIVQGNVSANDEVTLTLHNTSNGSVASGAANYEIVVFTIGS